jgi:hypothetical protein
MKVMPEVCCVVAVLVAGCATSSSEQVAASPEPMVAVADADADPEPAETVTIWDGVYTAAQASRGEGTANSVCFACHSPAEWRTPMFIRVWAGRAIHQMWENIRMTMPYDSPGALSAQEYTDVVAYMLQLNGIPEGDMELPSTAAELMQITVTAEQ